MQEITWSFSTATNCQAFKLTEKLLKSCLDKARELGRDYVWYPLDDDYWLPEKNDFNYEIACPNFLVFQTNSVGGNILQVEVHAIFEFHQGYQNYFVSFVRVSQIGGEPNINELFDIARMYAYLRFSDRDDSRDQYRHWWTKFLSRNVVSNETMLIFKGDENAALSWAQRTFPDNWLNAWIGKCGEFVFADWAGACGLSVSRIDLKKHEQGDEFDFSHNSLLLNQSGGNLLRLDIKTFQLEEANKERNWWNVGINCLTGEHRQDIIIFVVIDQYFIIGKVVGYLSPESILEKGEFMSGGFYRVHLDDLLNPYYLRAKLDSKNQFFEGLCFGNEPHKVITDIIKDYPLDPITAYYSGYDWQSFNRGGMINLTAKPTLKMFVSLYC